MMNYSACIFDLDGTLLNTLEDLKNSVNYALSQKGYPERSVEEVRNFIGNGIMMLIKRAVPSGTNDEDTQETLGIFKEHYLLHMNDNTSPYDGIITVLEKLRSRGVRTGVVTNKAHDAAVGLVKAFFGDLIEVTVGQKSGVPTKPDPAALNEVMTLLEINADNVLYLGDSDVDMFTAHNAGVHCAGVTWGFRDKELLMSADAEYVIDNPEEIIKILDNNFSIGQ